MTSTSTTSPETYRARMIERIAERGVFRSAAVQEAMARVPRHQFVPLASLEAAYGDRSVTTKEGDGPLPLSCASEPHIVAMMLEQLAVEPGQRVLEIGAGTGYNAALLAELVGAGGQVTTVDVYPDVVEGARTALAATGYDCVRVIHRDGGEGCAEHAPYDRIIVTVGPWDLPPAWIEQLTMGGRMVVPLRWRGQARSIAFVKEADRLRSDSMELCGFIPMTGPGQDGERSGTIDLEGLVTLVWDMDQDIDVALLRQSFVGDGTSIWSGVRVASGEPFDGLWLRLVASEPGTCRLSAAPPAVACGSCRPAVPSRTPALVEGSSLAYLSVRRVEDAGSSCFELGGIALGPEADELASRLCQATRRWGLSRNELPEVLAIVDGASEGNACIKKPSICIATRY